MTVATYTSDLTDIFLFESTTSVGAYGGGPAGLGAGPDYSMEGTNAVDKKIDGTERGLMYDNTSNFTIGADDHFFIWIIGATPGLVDTRNNRGIHVAIGDDTSNFVKFHVNGGDTLPLGGGIVYAVRFVNTTLTNFRTLVGTPGTTPSQIGGGLNITGTARFENLGVDAARIGTGYDILNGTGADPEADFAGIAADDEGTSEGVFQTTDGGFRLQGKLRIGSSGTACEFLDLNTNIFLLDTIQSLTDFTEILIENASSIVTLTNVSFGALGTNNLGRFEVLTSTATLTFENVGFIDFGVTILGSGSTLSNCRWIGSGIVTANGATLVGSAFSGYEGTADTSPLIWDTATDPNGELDNMTFTKGTAATHAIEFGTTSPLTMTITGMTSIGYNNADTNNDSTFHVKRTSGTVTINVVGGSGNFTYKSEGATVVIVIDPIATEIHVVDIITGGDIQNARVFLVASDGTGDLPFEESVTITRVTTVATVAHTAHGLVVGDIALIAGADQQEYNGAQTVVTVPGVNSYTFTVAGSPTTPATGIITSTGGYFNDLTSAGGLVTDTRTIASDQPVTGIVRKATASPFYKSSPLTGTVDNVTGLSVLVQLIKDE